MWPEIFQMILQMGRRCFVDANMDSVMPHYRPFLFIDRILNNFIKIRSHLEMGLDQSPKIIFFKIRVYVGAISDLVKEKYKNITTVTVNIKTEFISFPDNFL
jgi:hypothetical protein